MIDLAFDDNNAHTPFTIEQILEAINAKQFTQDGIRYAADYAHCTPCMGYTAEYIAKCIEVIASRNNKVAFIYNK